MNGNIKKIIYLFGGLFFILFSVSTCSTFMQPEGDAIAKPMIANIEKYKENNGHYPESLIKLIPDYFAQYDFQTFHYKYNYARGEKLERYIKKGLIPIGEGEGYVLTVRFQKHTEECIYINGQRSSCHYIGR